MSSLALLALIGALSQQYDMDPREVEAIITVESKWNQTAVGSLGEVGLLQLRPEYFPITLSTPVREQLRIGIKHLASIKARCPHRQGIEWVICHNVGVTGASRIRNPSAFNYVVKVREAYEARIETASK